MELVLVVFAGAISGGLIVAARVLLPPLEPETRPKAPPFPIVAIIIVLVSIAAAPGIGWVLAPQLVEYATSSTPTELLVTAPSDALLARAYAAALPTMWAAVPGLAALLWMLLSSRRSPKHAAVFASATTIGFTIGILFGLALVPSTFALLSVPLDGLADGLSGVDVHMTLFDVMSLVVRAPLGFGVAGAFLGAVWVTAATSPRGKRVAVWGTAAMPFFVALISALTTPPDVVSHVMMAFPMLVLWLVGLGGGMATRAILSQGNKRAAIVEVADD